MLFKRCFERNLFQLAKILNFNQKRGQKHKKCYNMKEISVKKTVFYNKIIKFAQYAIEMDVSFIIKWRILPVFWFFPFHCITV